MNGALILMYVDFVFLCVHFGIRNQLSWWFRAGQCMAQCTFGAYSLAFSEERNEAKHAEIFIGNLFGLSNWKLP